ncbi:NAD-dependent epimerase/dehydratase family protein [Nocardia takedensis]
MTGAVLVTGACGFIGSHTAAALHAAGWTVTGVDLRVSPGPVAWESLACSAADPAVLRRILSREFDVVVHNAAITDTLDPDDARLRHTNLTVPLRIADCCTVSGVRLVYASSGSVYGVVARGHRSTETDPTHPLNPYARSKLALERSLARFTEVFGTNCVGLRYTNVFGPGESAKGPMASILSQILIAAAHGQPVRLFDDSLSAARDYLPVRVLTDTILALLDASRVTGIYNLGSGLAVGFDTLLDWCAQWCGAPVTVNPIPNPVSDRYQYWTCADMRALRAALPDLSPVTLEVIRDHAHDLFDLVRTDPVTAGATGEYSTTGGRSQ